MRSNFPTFEVGDYAVHFELRTVVQILSEPSPGRYLTRTAAGAPWTCFQGELSTLKDARKHTRRLRREIRAARKAD